MIGNCNQQMEKKNITGSFSVAVECKETDGGPRPNAVNTGVDVMKLCNPPPAPHTPSQTLAPHDMRGSFFGVLVKHEVGYLELKNFQSRRACRRRRSPLPHTISRLRSIYPDGCC